MKILLAFGADLNQLNSQNKTPLDLAHKESACLQCQSVSLDLPTTHSKTRLKFEERRTSIKKLLNECGAVESKETGSSEAKRINYKTLRKNVCRLKFEHYYGENPVPECSSISLKEREEILTDWCRLKAELYHKYWTSLMKYPAPFSSCNLKEAAEYAIQVKNLRLLQMAGSRILVLDGGGMKGLVEIEILDQIERVTGSKILDLFDWIVGTSTGAVIALALVYGELLLMEVCFCYILEVSDHSVVSLPKKLFCSHRNRNNLVVCFSKMASELP